MSSTKLALPAPLQQALTKARIISAFHAFIAAPDLQPSVAAFAELSAECGAPPLAALREVDHFAVKRLVGVIDAKIAQYHGQRPLAGRRVLIVGAGPGGLRCAIEALVLGADVSVVEKRRAFSRHNVLVLWSGIVDDLYSLGLKDLFKQFGTSANSDKLCIRRMQLLLLKLTLLLGASVRLGLEFMELAKPSLEDGYGVGWRGVFHSDDDDGLTSGEQIEFECEHLVGADGEHSAVREFVGFPGTEVCFSSALGITFNLVNSGSVAEIRMQEVSRVRYAFPAYLCAHQRLSNHHRLPCVLHLAQFWVSCHMPALRTAHT
eukprot:6570522-Prymnesium_polylepis.1